MVLMGRVEYQTSAVMGTVHRTARREGTVDTEVEVVEEAAVVEVRLAVLLMEELAEVVEVEDVAALALPVEDQAQDHLVYPLI